MKNILAATGLALVLLAPTTFAQGSNNVSSDNGRVPSGGSAGSEHSQALAYGGLAALGAGAFIATVVALSANSDDNDNVNLGGTGTTSTTGTVSP